MAFTLFSNFYKASSILQKHGDREETLPTAETDRNQPPGESFTATSVRKSYALSWPNPLLTFLPLGHEALLRKGQLPLHNAGRAQCCRAVRHTGVTLCLRARASGRFHKAGITVSVGIQVFCVTSNKSEGFISSRATPRAAEAPTVQARSNPLALHSTGQEGAIKPPGHWERAFSAIVTMTDAIGSEVHSWLICCSPALGQVTASDPTLPGVPGSQRGPSRLPAGYLLFFKPQLGEVPGGMVFFFLNQQDFFFVLFYYSQFASWLQPKLTCPCSICFSSTSFLLVSFKKNEFRK